MKATLGRKLRPLVALIGGMLFIISSSTVYVLAQSNDDENPWLTPLNLSQSGAAVEPIFAIDESSDAYHVFWQDAVLGYVYSSNLGAAGWQSPTPVRVPFTEPAFTIPAQSDIFEGFSTPFLLADEAGFIHAFYSDSIVGDGALRYSRAVVDEITGSGAWISPQRLASSSIFETALLDANGRLHLAYIRPVGVADEPAGIYYRQSNDGGQSWEEPILLYASDYFRALLPEQFRMEVVAASDDTTIVAWDNPLIDTLFTIQSEDGGLTWAEVEVVDQRQLDDEPEASGPLKIDVILRDDQIHRTWQATHEDNPCSQYHQWSDDAGRSWTEPEIVFDSILECPADGRFVLSEDDLLFLVLALPTGSFMQVWDGEIWSEPQKQDGIATFNNPETFRPVQIGCVNTTVTGNNDLLLFGCGTEDNADVWVQQRPLGVLTDWLDRFAPTPVWKPPQTIKNLETAALAPIELVSDANGRLHAFWSQSDSSVNNGRVSASGNQPGTSIFYSFYEAERWSDPRPILSVRDGKAEQPAVTTDRAGNVYATWSGGVNGEVYFSRARLDRASSVSEWSDPILLPAPNVVGDSPTILRVGRMLHVAYAVPVNENRGIYVTTSMDDGATWSPAVRVYDAEVDEQQFVTAPRLAATANTVHIMWSMGTQPDGLGVQSMAYARSVDEGISWSIAELVAQEQVVWSRIEGIGDRNLHRVWLSINQDGQQNLWHQTSIDDGLSWTLPTRVGDTAVSLGPSTLHVTQGNNPQLYILQLVETLDQRLLLQEWRWVGDRWVSFDELELDESLLNANLITAVTQPDGRLNVVYGTLLFDEENQQVFNVLGHTFRDIEQPEGRATPLPTLTPTPLVQPTSTPTPGPSPTPTLAFSNASADEGGVSLGPISTNDASGGILVGILPALLIVGLVLIVGIRVARAK